MGTYVTANHVGIESIGMSAMRSNPKLAHHPKPLSHLEGNAYGYERCCSLCRWATGNKYMAQLSYRAYCNTMLCVWCNKYWRSVLDLVGIKEVLFREIILRKNAKEITYQAYFMPTSLRNCMYLHIVQQVIYIGSMLY